MELSLAAIKDIVTIVFYIIGAILAILTYLRARATVLQPKRAELVKKQTEIFSNFLSFINENENSIDHGLDYTNLFSYNVDLILRDYGLIEIDKSSETIIEFNTNISGWIQFLENDLHDYVFISGNLEVYDNLIFEKSNRERQKFYEAGLEKGDITVHRIFYTKKYEKFFKTLRAFANNPFLPEEIQKIAFQIGKDLRENIHSLLRAMLQNLVLKYYEATNSESPGEKIVMLEEFRHQSLYRVFEKERVKHDESFNELRKLIRKYLHIDEKW